MPRHAFEESGFRLIREGGNHSICSNGVRTIPVKCRRVFDRITANELCTQAGLSIDSFRRARKGGMAALRFRHDHRDIAFDNREQLVASSPVTPFRLRIPQCQPVAA